MVKEYFHAMAPYVSENANPPPSSNVLFDVPTWLHDRRNYPLFVCSSYLPKTLGEQMCGYPTAEARMWTGRETGAQMHLS